MLLFKVVKRPNPQDPEAPQKYYASAVPTKRLNKRELIEEISFATAINGTSVSGVLESLIELLPRYLGDGKLVHLGDFGSFRLTLSSEGMDHPDFVNSRCIKGVKVVFRPGKVLNDRLSCIAFEKSDSN